MDDSVVQKYNIPGPRYTSYPTDPYWNDDSITSDLWKESVAREFEQSNSSEGNSLSIHLPFCESLCTFCVCHKGITKNHSVESPHIDAVLNEWKTYRNLFTETPKIKELHLGGVTPVFFSTTI
ncbi:MAG: oxygen-independent coproporphyrinogen-3 oxidase [Planctomycetota bacterium]|jgi:oxygen-independent coproporphyrinogen-3 oxidase